MTSPPTWPPPSAPAPPADRPAAPITPPTAEPSWNQPGGLGIRERRSFATWQLVGAVVIATLVGMWIGASGGGSGKVAAADGATHSNFSLPPPKTPINTIGPSNNTVPTTATTEVTQTTAIASPLATGPVVVLVANTTGRGPARLPGYATAGRAQLGYAFSCALAPGGSGIFQVFVVPDAGGRPANPALSQNDRAGSGVVPAPGTGHLHLEVVTDPGCRWALKVTGLAG